MIDMTHVAWKNVKIFCWRRSFTLPARWKTFEGFVADMGHAPEGMSLKRMDRFKGPSVENCQWFPSSRGTEQHGMARVRTYNAWARMRHNHQGQLCERWQHYAYFFEDMRECPSDRHLIRIDRTKPFEPGNCRWGPQRDVHLDRKNMRKIEYEGRQYTLSQLAKLAGVSKNLMYWRLYVGKWPIEKAVSGKGGQYDE